MIGLGSNRLTVCRRGGMSVTQAGKGGMEWLAGGRTPLWAQWWLPYSRQAGEALKAQFPTQWPTIRDYGFAHPALVPFINEDPMLVMSLIEGLGERWIVGDGASWIESGMLVTKYIGVSVYIEHLSSSNCSMMYTQSDLGTGNRYGMSLYNGTGVVLNYNGTYHIIGNCTNTTQPHQYEFNKEAGKFKVDGVQKDSWTWNVEPSAYVGIFASHVGLEIMKAKSGSWIFYDNRTGDEVTRYIPYKHPTQGNGMLDVVNAVFYPNAGTGQFTISETPAA